MPFRPGPDFSRFLQVLWRQGEPDRVPLVELVADAEMMSAVLGERVPGRGERQDRRVREKALLSEIRFWYQTGHDFLTVECIPHTPMKRLAAEDTAPLKHATRHWMDETRGVINSWEDFEAYPWPRPEETDFFDLEFVGRHLPDGMQAIYLGGGHLETVIGLMGFVPFALALKDDPALVEAVVEKVGEMWVRAFATAAEMPGVGALWLGDDMGFKTSTMISRADLRRYVFPWQRQIADIAHAHGMPFLLHACGALREIMEDLIEGVRIDARHSFEDVIEPVTEAKQHYGQRIALLGGVDMDYLCRHTPEEVRAYTRHLIDVCAPGGGWALGTGNTVANYIPVPNYLAMVDEGRQYGIY